MVTFAIIYGSGDFFADGIIGLKNNKIILYV